MLQETKNAVVVYYLAGYSFVLLLITAIVTYAFLHQKKVVQLRLRLHDEEIKKQQDIFNALQDGEQKERTRLAEELHDGIGAKLSGLKMNLEYLKSNVTEHIDLVSTLFQGVAQALEEVREISHNLLPYYFNENELEQLLVVKLDQLNSLDGCRFDLFTNGSTDGLDNGIKFHCYRVITELVTNINKHSKATIASVQINVEDDKMEIVVEDNGIGMYHASSNTDGIGLKNIKNRITACKGTMNIDSSEKGTSAIIEIPIKPIL